MPIYQYEDTRNGSVVELEKPVAERDSVPRYLKRFQVPQRLSLVGVGEPLDLHDIYEQTGVFYYRSKNPEGGFQNPPIRFPRPSVCRPIVRQLTNCCHSLVAQQQ